MKLNSKTYLTVALVAFFANNCYAGDTEASSSGKKPEQPALDFVKLDEGILALLERNLPIANFRGQMKARARRKGLFYDNKSLNDLHKLYEARQSFEKPCTINRLFVFGHIYVRFLVSVPGADLRRVMEELLLDKPDERYVVKCFQEFDMFAERLYGNDTAAQDLMNKLLLVLSQETRESMLYNFIQADTNIKRPDNVILHRLLENVEFKAICDKTNADQHISEILDMAYKMLGPETRLRTKYIVEELNRQMDSDEPVNALKLICLGAFCNSLKDKPTIRLFSHPNLKSFKSDSDNAD